MTPQPDSSKLIADLTVLTDALARLSHALVTGQPEAVLAAEESLGAAARQLSARRQMAGEDRRQLVEAIRGIRVAVGLCERLGRASAALMQATIQSGPYAANGHLAQAVVPGTVVSRT
jgi:hypothetical protein